MDIQHGVISSKCPNEPNFRLALGVRFMGLDWSFSSIQSRVTFSNLARGGIMLFSSKTVTKGGIYISCVARKRPKHASLG